MDYQNLYVGPYAQWLVPVEATEGPPGSELPEVDFGHELMCNLTPARYPAMVRRGRKDYVPLCFMPPSERGQKVGVSGREMYFLLPAAWPPAQDLLAVDRQAEIEWFKTACAKALAALTEHYGEPPQFGWGVVCWPGD